MKYSFDSSALIDLGERHYPERLELFAPIWKFVYGGIERGDIVSVDYVKIELERKADDWRKAFLMRADGMFLMSEELELQYASVIKDIESSKDLPINKARERFLEGADPWLVAQARSIGKCTVVSGEKKPLASYGLGAVCGIMGVAHMNLVEFFETNKVGAR